MVRCNHGRKKSLDLQRLTNRFSRFLLVLQYFLNSFSINFGSVRTFFSFGSDLLFSVSNFVNFSSTPKHTVGSEKRVDYTFLHSQLQQGIRVSLNKFIINHDLPSQSSFFSACVPEAPLSRARDAGNTTNNDSSAYNRYILLY